MAKGRKGYDSCHRDNRLATESDANKIQGKGIVYTSRKRGGIFLKDQCNNLMSKKQLDSSILNSNIFSLSQSQIGLNIGDSRLVGRLVSELESSAIDYQKMKAHSSRAEEGPKRLFMKVKSRKHLGGMCYGDSGYPSNRTLVHDLGK